MTNGRIRLAFTFVFILWIQFGALRAQTALVSADGRTARITAKGAASEESRQAAADFRRILSEMGGAAGAQGADEDAPSEVFLCARAQAPDAQGAGDAFIVEARNGVLRIEGETPEALAQGIYWFLRELGGVRWYAPDDECAPKKRPWTLANAVYAPKPSFESRVICGLDERGRLWLLRNGMGNAVDFSHNLGNVVGADALKTHPQWRGFFAGETQPATARGARAYQPELHRTDLAAYAGDSAADFFQKNPQKNSFSLGLQDNVRFSQSQGALKARGELKFYRGLPDYSDTVFRFMNAAAERAAERGEGGKAVGCLAYMWNTRAPDFKIAPNLAPYVATDRSFWHVPAVREAERALLRKWAASGARLVGVYDYVYGKIFLIPRPLERLGDWLRDAWEAGARGYFSEAYPIYEYDTAKLWLTARLLWDADLDPRALNAEWLAARYGAGAEGVGKFFGLWNAAWESQTENIYWLRGYTNEEQGLLASPEMRREMRDALDRAAAALRADAPRARRLAALRARFEATDAFCREVAAKDALSKTPQPRRADEAARLRRTLFEFFAERAHLHALLDAQAECWRGAHARTNRADPSVNAAIQLAGWARAHALWGRERKRLERLAEHAGATEAFRDTVALLARSGGAPKARALLKNANFSRARAQTAADFNPLWEDYAGELPAAWQLRAIRTPGLRVSLEPPTKGGGRALRAEGSANTHLFQWTRTGGAPTLFSIAVRGEIPEGGFVQLIVSGKAHGKPFARETRLFAGDYRNGANLRMVSPPQAAGETCALGIIVAHQLPRQYLEFCNIRTEQAPVTTHIRVAARRAATNARR